MNTSHPIKKGRPRKIENLEKKMKMDVTFTCEDCGLSFKSEKTVENHQKKYQCGLKFCHVCGASARNMEQLADHMCKVLLNCDLCQFSSGKTKAMDLHKSFEHQTPLKCNLCDYQYKNYFAKEHWNKAEQALKYHMNSKHSSETYQCFDCGHKAKTKQKLE